MLKDTLREMDEPRAERHHGLGSLHLVRPLCLEHLETVSDWPSFK